MTDSNLCRFLYLNIRSLKEAHKLDSLHTLIDSLQSVDVVLLTETWLNEHEEKYYNLPGYSLISLNRSKGRGGGVAAYVKNSYTRGIVKSVTTTTYSILYFAVNTNSKFHIVLFYNPSLSNLSFFLSDFETILRELPPSNTLVMGDSNFNVLETPDIVSEYTMLINSYD